MTFWEIFEIENLPKKNKKNYFSVCFISNLHIFFNQDFVRVQITTFFIICSQIEINEQITGWDHHLSSKNHQKIIKKLNEDSSKGYKILIQYFSKKIIAVPSNCNPCNCSKSVDFVNCPNSPRSGVNWDRQVFLTQNWDSFFFSVTTYLYFICEVSHIKKHMPGHRTKTHHLNVVKSS